MLLHPSNLQYTFSGTHDVDVFITAGALDTLAIAGDTMKLFDGAHNVTDDEINYLQRVL